MKTPSRERRLPRSLALTGSIAAVTALSLAGCSGGPAESDGTTTIVVQQLSQWTPMMEALIEAFEDENPDIKVETQLVSDQTVNAQIIAGSNPPDIAWVPARSTSYTASIDAGKLLPLDDVWENQDLDARYGEPTASTLKADDGLPYIVSINSVTYNIVYYNTALFEAAGIEAPADHRIPDNETLFEIADALRDSGVQPLSINGKDVGMYGWMIDQFLQSAATDEQMANYLTNYLPSVDVTASYTDEPFLQAVEQVQALGEAGVFQDGYQAQDEPTATALFLQGQAGMVLGGSWMPDDIVSAGIDFDWMLLPGVPGGKPAQVSSYRGEAVAIPTGAAHPDEAKKFLEFWMSDDMQQQAVANTNTALPAVNTVDTSTLDALNPITQSIIADMNENDAPTGWSSTVPGALAANTVGPNLQLLLLGSLSVDDVAAAQQEALEKTRSEG